MVAQRGEAFCSRSRGWSEAAQLLELGSPQSRINTLSLVLPDKSEAHLPGNTIALGQFDEGKT